ncbi:MAG: hypothetical protein E7266_09160 [Lachnospiraceae bacterium]|nr:hypothetical protein [Lachnospiraceae bacterium]
MFDLEVFMNNINDSERVLVGLGEAMKNAPEETYIAIKKLLDEKNYFILYMNDDNGFCRKYFGEDRIAPAEDINVDGEKSSCVERYTKWLSMTINKRLVILELGASFLNPHILRWPFEKIVFYNMKSVLYRVNGKLPQVPEEIADRAVPVMMKPEEFVNKL